MTARCLGEVSQAICLGLVWEDCAWGGRAQIAREVCGTLDASIRIPLIAGVFLVESGH